MTREKAVAGHTLDARGISRSVISVGRMTVKPETKYSVRSCDMVMLNTNANSLQIVLKEEGRSLPSRSIRTSRDSSAQGWDASFSWESNGGVKCDAGRSMEAEVLDGRGDVQLPLLSVRDSGVAGNRTCMIGMLNSHCGIQRFSPGNANNSRPRGPRNIVIACTRCRNDGCTKPLLEPA